MDIHFKNKYLKYKSKYHNLKINMEGGKLNVRSLIEYVDDLISLTLKDKKENKKDKIENAKYSIIIAKLKLFKNRYLKSGSAPYCERKIRLKFDKNYKKDNQIKETDFKTSYNGNDNFKIIDCISINDTNSYNYVNDIILNFEKLVKLDRRPKNDNFFKPEYEDNILFDLFNSHDIGSYKLDMSEEAIREKADEIAYDMINSFVTIENKEEKEKFKKIIEDYKLKISPILEKRKIEEAKNAEEEIELSNITEHIKTFKLKRDEVFVNLLKEMNLKSGVEFKELIKKNIEIISNSFDNFRKHLHRYDKGLSIDMISTDMISKLFKNELDQYVSFVNENLKKAKIFEEKAKSTMIVRSGMTTLEKYIEKNAKKEGTTSVKVAEKLLNEASKLKDLLPIVRTFNNLIRAIEGNYAYKIYYFFYDSINEKNTIMEFKKLKESTKFLSILQKLREFVVNIEKNSIIKMESEKYPNKENVEGACVFPVYVKDGECKKIVFKSKRNLELVNSALKRFNILRVEVP